MEQPHGKKRKNRKSFLKNARKYGKKGNFGRGSHLNEDIYQYFVRVLELLKENTFENEEVKAVFINNVFDETMSEEVNYSCNQLASAVLENLLPLANDTVVERFMSAFGQDLRPICSDPYASHVLQRLLLTASERVKVSDVKLEDAETSEYEKWVLKVGNFVLNNLEDFVWDTYANHIIRAILECLGGISSSAADTNCKKQQSHGQAKQKIPTSSKKVPSAYTELLKEYVRRLSAWPQFGDLAYNNLTSGLLQTILFATKASDEKLTKKLIKKLLDECFAYRQKTEDDTEEKKKSGKPEILAEDDTKKKNSGKPEILAVFENSAATHLLEAALAVASCKSLTQIYAMCFINNLVFLSKYPGSNFSVQRLLDYCTQKEEYEQMYNEMDNHLEDILSSRNTGVISSLAEGCKRHGTKQGRFHKGLMEALHCYEPSERQIQLAPLVLSLKTYEQHSETEKLSIHLHGSLIFQSLLMFSKPIKAVNSLLEMTTSDIKTVFTDPKGSHVMDAFMKSTFVGEKSRDKMIKKLQGIYVALACSKNGSRSLDAIWEISNIKQKFLIMDELSAKEAILNSDQYGSIISSKYNVSLYRYQPEQWKDLQGKENRTRKLFADIIGDLK